MLKASIKSKHGEDKFEVSKEGLLSEAMDKLREVINAKMTQYCEIEKAAEKENPDAPADKKRKKESVESEE
ncbi:Oidioi.mRNA.OKI2018_I69.PAR.g11681.t1.cds [Oikopleura dioica]|uniref:Oidioi.mRNA.OKI2018_I69.PAR.g11681.t1.cds n=1 Tax=Oikopleura dioica TaxID=34765 RepID=A0ABN7S3L6_OIKDI|nr:Oidioi.mRNA.OKI2018_I69.PAR.g11681.t1.cds [Oikopleura dioica]